MPPGDGWVLGFVGLLHSWLLLSPPSQPVAGVGRGSAAALLTGALSVCDLTQLVGIVIGALLALALVGITVFFVYRRVNRFREYLTSDIHLYGEGTRAWESGGRFGDLTPVVSF